MRRAGLCRLSLLVLTPLLIARYASGQTNQSVPVNETSHSVTTNYPYEMPAGQKTAFLATLKTLKTGDSYDDVVKQLGQPWYQQRMKAKGSHTPVRGTYITFFLQKQSRDGGNERQDKYVSISFDNNGKLMDILTNIEGLSTNVFTDGIVPIWKLPPPPSPAS